MPSATGLRIPRPECELPIDSLVAEVVQEVYALVFTGLVKAQKDEIVLNGWPPHRQRRRLPQASFLRSSIAWLSDSLSALRSAGYPDPTQDSLPAVGHPLAVMDGLSLAAWNHIRATRDLDLLIAVGRSAIDPILNALSLQGCRPKKSPRIVTVGKHHLAQFLYTAPGEFYDVPFDLLLAESELQKSAIARRVWRDVPGIRRPVDVLHCEDLILFKLVSGRLIDRADAAMLLRENREAIDFDYLLSWVVHLDLTTDFTEIWREAYPDEDHPTGKVPVVRPHRD